MEVHDEDMEPQAERTMHVLFLAKSTQKNGSLVLALRRGGYMVDLVPTLPSGAAFRYDLVVLDLASAANKGIETVRRIRTISQQASILVLSDSNTLEAKLLYFELGIDDFVARPISDAEFVARVRASLRRMTIAQHDTLTISDLRLNRLSRRVFWHDQEINLTKKEFLLLQYLMLHAETVISRQAVMKDLWDAPYDESGNVVDVYIRQLRRKIEEPYGQKLIHTVRGDGYTIRENRKVPAHLAAALRR
jgi:two-component system, OmpR family, copper resistance phosphate regulon response regulator CusR